MAKTKEVTCILCPNACQLVVRFDEAKKEIISLDNLRCKRGEKYAAEELFDPKRSVMSVVPIESKHWKVTSVLTSEPIPKDKIFDVYNQIKKVRLKAPVKQGDVVIPNVVGSGADVIVTRSVME